MKVLCVDPAYGKRAYAGMALFDDGVLVYAADVAVPRDGTVEERIMLTAHRICSWVEDVDVAVGEWVQAYRGGPPASALIPLAGVVCAVAGLLNADLKFYKPSEWKAQVPRVAMPDRARLKLSAEELTLCDDLGNDGWHAVGLGLFHLGRVRRGMVV